MSALAAIIAILIGCAQSPGKVADEPTPWNSVKSVRDVTGDGMADTLMLEAFGQRPDSLKMIFRIRVGGHEAFRDEWDNFRETEDNPRISGGTGEKEVRKEMDEFFAASNFRPARELSFNASWTGSGANCDGEPRDCISFYLRFERDSAERGKRGLKPVPDNPTDYTALIKHIDSSPYDTALVERIGSEMQHGNALTFTYGVGYETTRTIAWSGVARRFFPVFESD